MIRLARPDEVAVVRDIDRIACKAFAAVGMDTIASGPGTAPEDIRAIIEAGHAWVATDDLDTPVAFVLVSVVDGGAHIEQIAVHPGWAHRGVGARLLDTVESWARSGQLGTLTLTTFIDVPWNAPYYERLGFGRVEPAELGPGERKICDANDQSHLGAWPRVTMRRRVSRGS